MTVLLLLSLASCAKSSPGQHEIVERPSSPESGISPTPSPTPEPVVDESPSPAPKRVMRYNDLEQDLLALFASVGIDGRVAEHGFMDAQVSGPWNGVEILVHALPTERARFSAAKIDFTGETEISGEEVKIGTRKGFGKMLVFTCDDIIYETSARGGGRGPIRSFLEIFVKAACSGS